MKKEISLHLVKTLAVMVCMQLCIANNVMSNIAPLDIVNVTIATADDDIVNIDIIPHEEIGYLNLQIESTVAHDFNIDILNAENLIFIEDFLNKKIEEGKHLEVLNLTEMPSGLYTIRVAYDKEVFSKKLIVMNE